MLESMKGVILAAGTGSRLSPITNSVNKHLLPVFDKPMIFYPLTTLMLAGIRDFLIIVNPQDLVLYKQLLSDGKHLGISIKYEIQPKPGGIPQGILIAKEFIGGENFSLILGDNIFYGVGLGRSISSLILDVEGGKHGSVIFLYKVSNPESYGVVELDLDGKIKSIIEKPQKANSNLAITGLYIFSNNALDYAGKLKPSKRGELEITEVIQRYSRDSELKIQELNLGTAWLDTGSFSTLHDAGTFVKIVQERQSIKIGDPHGAALVQGWI
jgi:glucose-1-phosphate thymidylyltransferase